MHNYQKITFIIKLLKIYLNYEILVIVILDFS